MSDVPNLTAIADRYVIEREIGSGGMAVVYLAHDRKLDRDVALKVLRPELGAVLGAERFLAEIKISARLDHPQILTLIDSGDFDGNLYYVLPYVRGETLREKLDRERQLSIDEALTITKKVASALDYAHRQGLVHRDIKPENILFQEGEPMLADFGIALAVSAAGGNRLTQTGLSLGTPQYMSPEQATGDRVDARSDVYSLAAVCYEMLAGEPPVTGATAQAMIAKLMTERPTRVQTLRETVNDSMDAAITRALAKTPADRFASAGEFARALEASLTAAAQSAPAAQRAVKPRALIAVGVVLALVAAGTILATRGRPASSDSRATLGTKTQLTSSGDVLGPAISPDGKSLAFVRRDCDDAECTYAIVQQDVGGTATRPILEGATTIYDLQWSPDRRNLIFGGVVNGKYGTFVMSALGEQPRFITLGTAAFYAGGDSLLIGPRFEPDSAFWIRIAGLDGEARDSVLVHGPGTALAGISAIPGTEWFLTLVRQPPRGLWQVIDRSGKVVDEVVNSCMCGGIGTVDAAWLARSAGPAGDALVRIAVDTRTGQLGERQDTMIIGHMSNVSVTADGASMVMDEGTTEFSTWAIMFEDAIQGRVPEDGRLIHSSISAYAEVSPDGARLLYHRVVPTSEGRTEEQHTIGPFGGGSEVLLPFKREERGLFWYDSVTVAAQFRDSIPGRHFVLVDVRTGAERNRLDIPDTLIGSWAAFDDGYAWTYSSGRRIAVNRAGKRTEYAVPDWYRGAFDIASSVDGTRLYMIGYDRATEDTIGVDELNLGTGTFTRWMIAAALDGRLVPLTDGTVLLAERKTSGMPYFYRLDGPGRKEYLGRSPRPRFNFSFSLDLKRVTAYRADHRGDAWMYKVIK